MANSKPHRLPSAAKHMRADAKKRTYNRARKVKVRDSEKTLNAAIEAGNKEAVIAQLNKCYSELDKAAKTGVIHKNKAANLKSKLCAYIAKLG